MIRPIALLVALAAGPAHAEIARVQSGEHPDFTRIVVEAATVQDWRFGRTSDGYELDLAGEVTGFDLSSAFEKIPKDRVSGLWQDPVTGRLKMSLSCACHAIAFEFRPGIVVVDVKSGPPPAGSSFELALDPPSEGEAPIEEEEPRPEDNPGYDWLALWQSGDLDRRVDGPDLNALNIEAETHPFRDALLAQISKGAAEGIVAIAEHPELPAAADAAMAEKGIRAGVGELPGITVSGSEGGGGQVSANGEVCLPDRLFAVKDWRPDGKVAEVLGLARTGVIAEFDVPVPEAILRAARIHVAFGFGAEARQMLDLEPVFARTEDRKVADLLRAMSYVVDLEPSEAGPLSGMESCDGAVSLWSVLSELASDRPVNLSDIETGALLLAFSGLPPDLRRHFSPTLVDWAIRSGDQELARALRDATTRAPGETGPGVALMEAQVDLAAGESETALETAEAVMLDGGPMTAEAAIMFVEAAFSGGQPVPETLPEVLRSFLQDQGGPDGDRRLRRALVLSSALSGDLETAFRDLAATPETEADLWTIAARSADDNLFLDQAIAVSANPDRKAGIDPDVAMAVAERLLSLGFAKEALGWIGPVSSGSDPARNLLAGRAYLRQKDARAALAAVSGLSDPEAEVIRAEAVLQLGDPENAALFFQQAGNAEAGMRALLWSQDWAAVASNGPDVWKAAAETVVGSTSPPPASAEVPPEAAQEADPAQAGGPVQGALAEAAGPLARGRELADESERARIALEALLQSLDAPEGM